VPWSEEQYLFKDGDSWLSDKGVMSEMLMRIRLTISFDTLRYKRSVEILNPNSTVRSEVSRYGRCERIPSTVLQKAN
jgi:hypothetical protein